MYDHNVFAVLTASDSKNKATSAFNLPQNAKWFRKASEGIAEEPTIDSREPTPAPQVQSAKQDLDVTDRLVVTFNESLKNPLNGVQFGTNPISSDVLLGHRGTGGISARQYNITVDGNLCIWLHDYHSTHGTAVEYNDQNQKEVRRKEAWILSYGPRTPSPFEYITIHSGGLAIEIEFPNHEAADPRYIENLRAFVKKSKEAVPPVDGLGLDSDPTTAKPSQAQTPGERAIYFHEKIIGKGMFGEVSKAIRARDGKHVAVKRSILPTNKRKRDEVSPAWREGMRKEFAIMRDNPHFNVMRVIEFRESPEPLIVMDYYHLGNIMEADVTYDQYVAAFGQILDGLDHLHAKGVAHRDLKPENFLVEKVPFFKVVITDFGLSKVMTDTTFLKTFCGTLKYLAPEVFPGISDGYKPSMDTWALGVIAFEWLYGIPDPPTVPTPRKKEKRVRADQWYDWIDAWSQWLLNKLNDEDDDPAVEILLGMIEVRPEKRWPTDRCLGRGLQNGLFRRADDGLVVDARHPTETGLQVKEGDDEARALRVPSPQRAQAGKDPEATIMLGNMWGGEGTASSPAASIESSPSRPPVPA